MKKPLYFFVILWVLCGCSKKDETIILNGFLDEPLNFERRYDLGSFKSICDEIKEDGSTFYCLIENDEFFKSITVEDGIITQIYLEENAENHVYTSVIYEQLNLNSKPQVTLLGSGSLYKLNSSISVDVRWYKQNPFDPARYNVVIFRDDDSENEPVEPSVFKQNATDESSIHGVHIGQQFIGKIPVGYVCDFSDFLNIAKCVHENYWYFEKELSEGNDDAELVEHSNPDIMLLHNSKVVLLADYLPPWTNLEPQMYKFGGKQRFARELNPYRSNDEPALYDSYYGITPENHLVVLRPTIFGENAVLELYAADSYQKKYYIENQNTIAQQEKPQPLPITIKDSEDN